MFKFNMFRKITKETNSIKNDLQVLIAKFKELEKENAILLEEIRMLKKLLYGIELDNK